MWGEFSWNLTIEGEGGDWEQIHWNRFTEGESFLANLIALFEKNDWTRQKVPLNWSEYTRKISVNSHASLTKKKKILNTKIPGEIDT